jgi:Mrp family chromosome partitioning ATPase
MGKILEALKRTAACCPPEVGKPCLHRTSATEPELDDSELEASEVELPFVEVGPRKSFEASPGVLATRPMPPAVANEPADLARETMPLRKVTFRNIPPEMRDQQEAPSRFVPELIAFHNPEHPISQQYRHLLPPVLAAVPEARSQVLLFTSAVHGSGTTTVLLNVAITAVREARKRVVVVDGNLRRPALAERLGMPEAPGVREVLAGVVPLEKALRETEQTGLLALTAGLDCPANGLRFVAETIRSLLRQLRHRFDLVLVDGPRWDGQPDVVLLGTACDAVYLVLPEAEADSAQVDDLYQVIPEQGARLAGCIVAGN